MYIDPIMHERLRILAHVQRKKVNQVIVDALTKLVNTPKNKEVIDRVMDAFDD